MRARTKAQAVDIYIISLDTFMLLAVLGITLGILFIIINPKLGVEPPPPPNPKSTISNTDLNVLMNEIDTSEFNSENDEYDYVTDLAFWKRSLTNNDIIKRFYGEYRNIIYQIRQQNNQIHRLEMIITDSSPTQGDSISVEWIVYTDNTFSNNNKDIQQEVKYWKKLYALVYHE